MHGDGLTRESQDILIAALVDALGFALDSTVMGIVGVDEQDVFILPMPGHAVEVFRYMAGVDWAAKAELARKADAVHPA